MKSSYIYIIICLLLLPLGSSVAKAEKQTTPIDISAKFVAGQIIPISKNQSNVVKNPMLGAEFAVEFPSLERYAWHKQWGRPTVGAAFSYYNLGNNAILGNAVALYPYILVPIVDKKHFALDYRLGAGLSFFDKTWNRLDTLSGVNAPTANSSIGSVVNAYITTGLSMSFNLSSNCSVGASVDYIHMSNGSMLQPNGGLNIISGSLALRYKFNNTDTYKSTVEIPPHHSSPCRYYMSIALSGGARELYYKDAKMYGIASLNTKFMYRLANFYSLGAALDAFYDGVYVQQGTVSGMTAQQLQEQRKHTHFNKYLITNEDLSNKFRVGLSLSNEFIMGRVTAILDFGIYLYDPIRNKYPSQANATKKRGILYKYDTSKEDGWNYFRLGIKYRIYDNLYLQTALKTHLSIAEFIEFGMAYSIPFKQQKTQ